MDTPQVLAFDDPHAAYDTAGAYLSARPVEHNILLTLLSDRVAHPEPGRYWAVTSGGAVRCFAFQSPPTYSAAIAPTSEPAVLDVLATALVRDAPDLPGVTAEAATAAGLAGRFTELRSVGAVPVEAQRLYRLDRVEMPAPVNGARRVATAGDREVLVPWARAFHHDTGSGPGDPTVTLERRLDEGRVHVWDDGEPRAMALATSPVARVTRVGLVYTPPELRRRGYAAALVAALSAHVLAAEADTCVLYTQLQNATSNGVYRRIGYVAVSEIVAYRFTT
jgi:GNAT superfamily N-acetyltransferase